MNTCGKGNYAKHEASIDAIEGKATFKIIKVLGWAMTRAWQKSLVKHWKIHMLGFEKNLFILNFSKRRCVKLNFAFSFILILKQVKWCQGVAL